MLTINIFLAFIALSDVSWKKSYCDSTYTCTADNIARHVSPINVLGDWF